MKRLLEIEKQLKQSKSIKASKQMIKDKIEEMRQEELKKVIR